MHKENAALWKVKPLLSRLLGDHNWAACESLVSDNDAEFFEDDSWARFRARAANGSVAVDPRTTISHGVNGAEHRSNGDTPVNGNKSKDPSAGKEGNGAEAAAVGDVAMADVTDGAVQPITPKEAAKSNGTKVMATDENEGPAKLDKEEKSASSIQVSAEAEPVETNGVDGKVKSLKKPVNGDAQQPSDVVDAQSIASKATIKPSASEANGSRAPSLLSDPADSAESTIHPLYLIPASARPGRDQGLPEPEAEDLRRLVQLWVQKQEEVTRGTRRLYDGLLRSDRLRRTVLKWAKAEIHTGEMSDGEDWYDKDEWGLIDDLKKGHDEEEEDTQQTQKKTRNRR
jgi:hypothetical protein